MAFTKVAPAGIGSTPGDGYRIGDSFLHSTGVEITNINATGIVTAASLDISGAIDFDGHTELDNVNISGVSTFAGNIDANGDLDVDGDLILSDTIYHNGDTNTKIRFPAADTISFETGGYERIRINSSGSVGINTTVTAATQLQVQSDGTSTTVGGNIVARFQSNGSGRDATIQLSDNVAHSATLSMLSSALVFKQSGTETLRIDSTGRVMIATTVAGTNSDLTIGDASSGSTGRIRIRSASNGGGYIDFQDTTGSTVDGSIEYNHILNSFNFYFESQERFRIHTQGMLGLSGANYGTSGQVLTSGGSGSAVSWTTITTTTINNNADNRVITGTGSANVLNAESNVHVDGSGRLLVGTSTNNAHTNADNAVISGTGNIGLSIMSTDSGRSSIYFGDSSSSPGSYAGFIDFVHSSNSFNIGRGNDNSLIIDSSGRVIIGNSSPVAGKLEVNTGTEVNGATEYSGEDFAINIRANRGDNPNEEGNGICFSQRWYTGDNGLIRTGAIVGYKISGNGSFGGGLKIKVQQAGASALMDVMRLRQTLIEIPADNVPLQFGIDGDFRIRHTGTENQIYGTGTHPIVFSNSGGERLRIFSNGSVGVGNYSSTNLTHAFQALRTSGSTYVSSKNTGGNAIFYAEASGGNTAKLELMQAGVGNFTLEVGGTNALMFKDDGTEKLRINSGSVWINGSAMPTSSSGARLQVGAHTFTGSNYAYATSRLGIQNNGSLTCISNCSTYTDVTYPGYGFVMVQGASTSDYNTFGICPDSPQTGSDLNFHAGYKKSNIHSDANVRQMWINMSGQVYKRDNGANWNTTSDERLKKNIVDNHKGLAEINQLRITSFEYRKADEIDMSLFPKANDPLQVIIEGEEGPHTGVIAQEIESIFPECVETSNKGAKTVQADAITWALVNAVKELSAKNDALEERIKNLEGS